jgi:hypothetical protein
MIAADAITCSNRTVDVGGVGPGPRPADFGGALRAVAHAATLSGTAQPAGDMFVSALQELSAAEMTALLNIIQPPESPQQAERLDDLLRAAVAAIAEGDGNRAMGHLTELAEISPRRAETLGSLPSLSSIRGAIERLVSRLNVTARAGAEARLAQAVKLMESLSAKEPVVREIRIENLIVVAGRLLDAGGYANSVWSAELSQLVIDPRLWAPIAVPLPSQVKDRDGRRPVEADGFFAAIHRVCARLELISRTRRLWFRAPLLVLLLAWFIVGLAGGAFSALVRKYWPGVLSASMVEGSFELWALGFLVLVAVGFYLRVRNLRF